MFVLSMRCLVFFFFSSRRRHTRFDCDWSSDVCSSDLNAYFPPNYRRTIRRAGVDAPGTTPGRREIRILLAAHSEAAVVRMEKPIHMERSEERRVGKECRSRWSPDH